MIRWGDARPDAFPTRFGRAGQSELWPTQNQSLPQEKKRLVGMECSIADLK